MSLFYNATVTDVRVFRDLEKLRWHFITGFFHHFREISFWVTEQFVRMVELDEPPRVHNHNAVWIHDRVQAMCNC